MARTAVAGIVALVGGALVAAYGALGEPDPARRADEVAALPGVLLALLVTAALVFAGLLPWTRRLRVQQPGRVALAAMACSALGIVCLLVFWTGISVVLGAGGVMLGQMGRRRGPAGERGLAFLSAIVGIAAVVLCIAVDIAANRRFGPA